MANSLPQCWLYSLKQLDIHGPIFNSSRTNDYTLSHMCVGIEQGRLVVCSSVQPGVHVALQLSSLISVNVLIALMLTGM